MSEFGWISSNLLLKGFSLRDIWGKGIMVWFFEYTKKQLPLPLIHCEANFKDCYVFNYFEVSQNLAYPKKLEIIYRDSYFNWNLKLLQEEHFLIKIKKKETLATPKPIRLYDSKEFEIFFEVIHFGYPLKCFVLPALLKEWMETEKIHLKKFSETLFISLHFRGKRVRYVLSFPADCIRRKCPTPFPLTYNEVSTPNTLPIYILSVV